MTNVVAINGSLNMDKGNTAKILGPFLDGMREAGASVQLFYAKQLDIRPCTGEGHCWRMKPGQCCIDDSMQSLYPRLRAADILVLATPVYIPLPGEMQNLINRLAPLGDTVYTERNGRTCSRLRSGVKISKIVLVSTGGWWEIGNFGRVVRIVEELARISFDVDFSGALLRPLAASLTDDNPKTKQVLDAARQAGHQLVAEGKMAQSLLDLISQALTAEPKWWSQAKEETDDDG